MERRIECIDFTIFFLCTLFSIEGILGFLTSRGIYGNKLVVIDTFFRRSFFDIFLLKILHTRKSRRNP